MIVVSADELLNWISMADAISAVRDAFIMLANGQVDQPGRMTLSDGSVLAMLARVGHRGAVAKLISVQESNRLRGLPTIHSVVLWFAADTGEPVAMIDGAALTSLRTGAASGVATDLLADPRASVLAMVGAGVQALEQVRAILTVRRIREVRVTSRTPESSNRFIDLVAPMYSGVRFTVQTTVADAVRGAQIVCTATTAAEALLHAADVADGCHINAIGAHRPDMCEISPELLARAATVSVDQVKAALAEAGDVIQAIDAGAIAATDLVELGTLLQARLARDPIDVTVFKSVGIAVQDWAVAALAVERISDEAPSRTEGMN